MKVILSLWSSTRIGKKMASKLFALSLHVAQQPPKEEDMSNTDVRFTLDPNNPPPLTDERRRELEELRNMKDEDIDLSDIPELPDSFWKTARRGDLYRTAKESVTVRIDSDVLLWLKAQGKGYQTRINAILRLAMLRDLNK
jgi:uncharacterized protein (DUF4415 family)